MSKLKKHFIVKSLNFFVVKTTIIHLHQCKLITSDVKIHLIWLDDVKTIRVQQDMLYLTEATIEVAFSTLGWFFQSRVIEV